MSPSLISNLVQHSIIERSEEEASTKHKQVNVRIHPSVYTLLERVSLELGKSPTATAQRLLVTAIVEAAQEVGLDPETELDVNELLFIYPWMFTVTDVRVVEQEEEIKQ